MLWTIAQTAGSSSMFVAVTSSQRRVPSGATMHRSATVLAPGSATISRWSCRARSTSSGAMYSRAVVPIIAAAERPKMRAAAGLM